MVWVIVVIVLVAAVAGAVIVRRRSGGVTAPADIDPFTLSEPWRRHVAASQSTQRRYASLIADTKPGPLRDRLGEIERQVQRSVDECWEVARRGDELDEALERLNTSSLRVQLQRTTDDAERASLESQVASSDRIRRRRDDADAQLRLLNVRMGELVAQAAEVSVGSDATEQLGSAVDDVVTQLHALRLALQDVDGGAAGSTGQAMPST